MQCNILTSAGNCKDRCIRDDEEENANEEKDTSFGMDSSFAATTAMGDGAGSFITTPRKEVAWNEVGVVVVVVVVVVAALVVGVVAWIDGTTTQTNSNNHPIVLEVYSIILLLLLLLLLQ